MTKIVNEIKIYKEKLELEIKKHTEKLIKQKAISNCFNALSMYLDSKSINYSSYAEDFEIDTKNSESI
jgi:hypothetical protein